MKPIGLTHAAACAMCACALISLADASPATKARTTRGFKNAALSTARGFGKRAGLQLDHQTLQLPLDSRAGLQLDHRGLQVPLESIDVMDAISAIGGSDRQLYGKILNQRPDADSFSAEWFARELAGNSELARLVTSRLADQLAGDLELARLLTSTLLDRNQDGQLTPEELLTPSY